MKKYYDDKKLYLGFEFHNMEPVVKTDPDFTSKKKLEPRDEYALRWAAMYIIDQINAEIAPDMNSNWKEIDDSNFFAGDALNLYNGDGVICANGDIMHCLYLAPGGQIMALMSTDEDLENTYNILIS